MGPPAEGWQCSVCKRYFKTSRGLSVHKTAMKHHVPASVPRLETAESDEPERGCSSLGQSPSTSHGTCREPHSPLPGGSPGRAESIAALSQRPRRVEASKGMRKSRESGEDETPEDTDSSEDSWAPPKGTGRGISLSDESDSETEEEARPEQCRRRKPAKGRSAHPAAQSQSEVQSAWVRTGARPKSQQTTPLLDLVETGNTGAATSCGEKAQCSNPESTRERASNHVQPPADVPQSTSPRAPLREAVVITSHLQCPECGRAFTSKVGVSLHRRKAHFASYNADIVTERVKARWTPEEEYLMAKSEAKLRKAGKRNLNELLAECFKDRSFDSIKSHRKINRYKELVEKLLETVVPETVTAVPEAMQTVAAVPDATQTATAVPEADDAVIAVESRSLSGQKVPDAIPPQPQPDSRESTRKELANLVQKQPPSSYQAPRLWEIVKRLLDGHSVALQLNDYLRDVFHNDRAVTSKRPTHPAHESKRKRKRREYAQTQERFKKNQGACAREVLDGQATHDVKDSKALLEEWRSVMEAPETATVSTSVERVEVEAEIDPYGVISAQEIKAAMLPLNSAAGPDGFTVKQLRQVPSVVLRVLLNALALLKRLPVCLRNARTTFIPKKAGASQAGDFRPITVSSVLVRMLHKIYATRLLAAMNFDLRQRAFIPADGCAENIMVLATALDEAKSKQRPLCMASVDVAKAFDRVNLAAILRGMKRKGLSSEFVDYVQNFYETSTTVLTMENETLLVHPTVGVRQGDPLSPLLFNLVIDEWLATCDKNIKFESGDFSVDCMAFADDLVVMASTPRGLQQQLCALELFLAERGMSINASKSLTLTMLPSGRDKVTKVVETSVYRLSGVDIPVVNTATCWRYLGIRFQAVGKERTAVDKEVRTLLNNISKAPLKPQQRLVVLKYYMIPRLYHRLVLGPVTAKLLLKIDSLIRAGIRRWLVLPHDVPLGFFYARTEHGGLGVPCVRTLVPGMRMRRLAALHESESAVCRGAARRNYATSQAQQAEKLCVYRGQTVRTTKESQRFWQNKLHTSADGIALKGCHQAKGSTNWLGEGTPFLRGREFINLVKIHINALPNLTRLKRGRQVPTQCRGGCLEPESLGHITQKCHRTHHERIRRHDVLVRYVANRLRQTGWAVKEEPHYRTPDGTRIPDLVLTREGQAVILDVQVVGTRIPLSSAHQVKCAKYMLPALLDQVAPNTRALVSSVTLSYRGVWAVESVKTLVDLGLTAYDIKMLSVRCLQGGLRAFWAHQKMTQWRSHG